MSVNEIELDVIMNEAPKGTVKNHESQRSREVLAGKWSGEKAANVDPAICSCLTGECGQGLMDLAQHVMMENIYR